MPYSSKNQTPTINHLHQTVIYCFAFAALGLTTGSLGPTLPTLAQQTGVGLSTVGFLFTARSFGFMFGAYQGGKLVDKVSGHLMVACAIGLMSLMMVATPLSSTFWLLIFVMWVLGIAESTLDVSCNTLLVWTHGERVGPFMNGVHFFYGVGAFLSPVIIAWLASFGHKSAFWLLGLLVTPGIILFLIVPSPHKQIANDEILEKNKTDTRIVFLIAALFFLYVGAEVSFGGWIYTYLIKLKPGSETDAAYLTAGFWGALTVGRLFSIPFAKWFKLEKLLLADLIGSLLSLSLILLLPDSSTAVWVGTIALGLSLASFFPTLFSFAERATTVTGKIAGRILVGASTGAMTIPWASGQLFEKISPQAAMVLIAATMAVALVIFVILMQLVKQKKSENLPDKFDSLLEAKA